MICAGGRLASRSGRSCSDLASHSAHDLDEHTRTSRHCDRDPHRHEPEEAVGAWFRGATRDLLRQGEQGESDEPGRSDEHCVTAQSRHRQPLRAPLNRGSQIVPRGGRLLSQLSPERSPSALVSRMRTASKTSWSERAPRSVWARMASIAATMSEALRVAIAQSATCSAAARAATAGLRSPAGTRSTFASRMCSRSSRALPSPTSPSPAGMSARRSTSLSSRSSPLATLPKTRRLVMPWTAAASTSFRRRWRTLRPSGPVSRSIGRGRTLTSRSKPVAATRAASVDKAGCRCPAS